MTELKVTFTKLNRNLLVTLAVIAVISLGSGFISAGMKIASSSSKKCHRQATKIGSRLPTCVTPFATNTIVDSIQNAVNNHQGSSPAVSSIQSSFSAEHATLVAGGISVRLGIPAFGRGGNVEIHPARYLPTSTGAIYQSAPIREVFRREGNGNVEQVFSIAKAPVGRGPLIIKFPAGEGLTVTNEPGNSVGMGEQSGPMVFRYGGLEVRDATGHPIAGSLRADKDGRDVEISIDDGHANYPITIDPTWVASPVLLAPDGGAFAGTGIALDGNELMIGGCTGLTPDSCGPASSNAIYVFHKDGISWSSDGVLSPVDGTPCSPQFQVWGCRSNGLGISDGFGDSVAVSGSTAIAGAFSYPETGATNGCSEFWAPPHNYNYINLGQGKAYVFTKEGSTWVQTAEFLPTDAQQCDDFGLSVAIDGTTAVVGAPGHTVGANQNQGAVYVFQFDGSSWVQTTELTASDGEASDAFGAVIAFDGTNIVVGSPLHSFGANSREGAVYVFSPEGSSWVSSAEIPDPGGGAYDYFGSAISVSGTSLAVVNNSSLAVKSAYVFSDSLGGWTLTSQFPIGLFPPNIDISGNNLVAADAVYSWSKSTWDEVAQFPQVPFSVGCSFGYPFPVNEGSPVSAISGNTAAYLGYYSGSCSAEALYTYSLIPNGYWEVAADGGVFSFGDAGFYGSAADFKDFGTTVGLVPTPDGKGYWLASATGKVFAFGDASYYGSKGGQMLSAPIVGMAATSDGKGYWLVASDGGVFAFGDAVHYGSLSGAHLISPIVAIAATPDGHGYWLLSAGGGVFTFGDARFYGSITSNSSFTASSMGYIPPNGPIVDISATPDGKGYWLLSASGNIFTFGDAFGSPYGAVSVTSMNLSAPAVGMVPTAGTTGYWVAASDGDLGGFNEGLYGSMAGQALAAPIVGIAASP